MQTFLSKAMLVAVTAATLTLAGCETQPSRPAYYGNGGSGYSHATRGCQQCGVVDDIQQIYVQKQSGSAAGTILGAVIGGVLGNQIGRGDGRTAATVVGAVGGGAIGNQISKNNGEDVAFQVRIRLDNGQWATVTQREDPQLRRGDYVEIRGDHVYRR
ncbi:outer membrane lipoprotein SlyB [Luteibacter sp. Sphag1AF]|uniref:glycine zipper 2TM domain-containing protein n=1 Tax=Luteibacter sp. Sphag1AF TaxID=2587031 RepID=UPI001621F335|nr:glycine zipper 2TM domain-containing protein [Luteibacter sp. Sphag1AF]MBB3228395.1 outer membrane lipoprotein SlyB [Luteibacter sp. Sphag1AF]